MFKKIFSILMVAIFATLVSFSQFAYAASDPSIDINIIRDNTTITIEHFSQHKIGIAVVEFSFYENEIYYSELQQFDVVNNKFKIPANTVAIKVHQVKVLNGQTWFTYLASGNNQIGSFAGVQRRNIVEIETVAANIIDTRLNVSASHMSTNLKVFEFYFNFDKEHDSVYFIDFEYVLTKYFWFWIEEQKRYHDSVILDRDIEVSGFYEYSIGTTSLWDFKTNNYIGLEINKNNDYKANYVCRVAPEMNVLDDLNNAFLAGFTLDNFIIIRIGYLIDGEFIIDEVINNPWTPEQEAFDWFLAFINEFQAFITWFQTLDFNNILVIVLVAIVVILFFVFLGPAMSLIKLIISLITLMFKIPGKIVSFIKYLFIPPKQPKRGKGR